MMGLTRREGRLSMMLAASLLILLITPIFWITDRRMPRDIKEIVPPTEQVNPGEDVKLTFRGIFHFNCDADVEEQVIDSEGHVWPVERRRGVLNGFPPGKSFERQIDISTVVTASPGIATYSQNVAYKCNPFQRYFWPIRVHREVKFVFAGSNQGPKGDPGPQGPIGPQGERGDPGPPGEILERRISDSK